MAHTAGFLTFPSEVLLQIANADFIDAPPRGHGNRSGQRLAKSPRDLNALMRTCWKLHDFFEPTLYAYNRDHEGSYAVTWAAGTGIIGTLNTALAYGLSIDEAAVGPLSHKGKIGSKIAKTYYGLQVRNIPMQTTGSPLQRAVCSGQITAAAWFLDHAVGTNGHPLNGDTRFDALCHRSCTPRDPRRPVSLLHVAICRNKLSMVQFLVARGASLEYATEKYANMHALLDAAFHGSYQIVEYLVRDRGLNIAEVTMEGCNALAFAAMRDVDDVTPIRRILEIDATLVNGTGPDWDKTPLHQAIRMGNFAVATYLLEQGAIIDPQHSIFEGASNSGPMPVTDYLLLLSQRPRARKQPENIQRGQDLLRSLLTKHGADPNEELRDGRDYVSDALGLAISSGLLEDAATLLEHGATMTSEHAKIAGLWNYRNGIGEDPLLFVMRYGISIESVFDSLVEGLYDWGNDDLSKDPRLAIELDRVLGHATKLNVSDDFLIQKAEEYLDEQRYDLFLAIAGHAPWNPSTDLAYYHARRLLEHSGRDGLLSQVHGRDPEPCSNDMWHFQSTCQQTLSHLLPFCTYGSDSCLLFSNALREQNLFVTNFFLNRGVVKDPQNSAHLPGFLVLAIQWGQMPIIRQIWRSLAIVQKHPAFVASCLYQAICRMENDAAAVALFFVQNGADPFRCMDSIQSTAFAANLDYENNILCPALQDKATALKNDTKVDLRDPLVRRQFNDGTAYHHLLGDWVRYFRIADCFDHSTCTSGFRGGLKSVTRRRSPLQLAVCYGVTDVLHALLGGINIPEDVKAQAYYVSAELNNNADEVRNVLSRYGMSLGKEE